MRIKRNVLLWMLVTSVSVSCTASKSLTTESRSSVNASSGQNGEVAQITGTAHSYKPERTKLNDLVHTKLEVSFDWLNKTVSGKATLELKPYFYPQSELILDAKNFDINSIGLITPTDTSMLSFSYDGLKLHISLDRSYTRDEKFLVYIDYLAKPYDREAGGSAAIKSDRGLFFINADGSDPDKPRQIWTQGETENNSFWFPTIDSPNERTTQEIYITVEDKFLTLSNGLLISSIKNQDGTRTDYWKMDLPHAPYLFMLAVGEFAVVKDKWGDIDVDYYVEPEYQPYAKKIFGATPEMMTFFSDLLGYQFPWPKYSQIVVRDYVSGAMENTTASVFMEDLQIDDRELIDNHWEGIIAHELFHQWIGDLLTCESWANLPLNEAFANYSEYLWYEYKYGRDEADYHSRQELNQYLQESQSKQEDLIRFYYDDKESMFDSHSYAKGGRILHMLREYLGDEAFFASLKRYVNKHAFSDVEVHDLRLAFEETTGEDLNWFFNQWFLASGHPQIKIVHSYDSGNLKVEVWQNQDVSKTPLYKLPIDIAIWLDEEQITYSLNIEDAYQQFNFKVRRKPDLVLFDSKNQLLAEIEHEKTRDELVFQYYNSSAFLPRIQALELLAQDADKNAGVLIDALNDRFWVMRQMAVNAFDEYKGDRLDEIKEKVKILAEKDAKSVVRADAINLLSLLDLNGNKDIYMRSLTDSSYSVLGVALMAISESNIREKMEIFEQFETLNNLNVFLPIASYYARNNRFEKYGWFDEKIRLLSGTDLWYMLQFFGEYLMNAPEEQKKKGLNILETEARNNKSYYIRLAAYQALGLLEDMDGVAKIREDIRKKETDNRLNRIYSTLN